MQLDLQSHRKCISLPSTFPKRPPCAGHSAGPRGQEMIKTGLRPGGVCRVFVMGRRTEENQASVRPQPAQVVKEGFLEEVTFGLGLDRSVPGR